MPKLLCRYEQRSPFREHIVTIQALNLDRGLIERTIRIPQKNLSEITERYALVKLTRDVRHSPLAKGYSVVVIRDRPGNFPEEFHVPTDNLDYT